MHNSLITVTNINVLLEIQQSTKYSENGVGTNGMYINRCTKLLML